MTPDERNELQGWLRLALTPGVGPVTARRLLAAFGSAPAIFAQPRAALLQCAGAARADALLAEPAELATAFDALLAWLAADARHHVWPLGHPDYPTSLYETADPPLVLYACGRAELARRPAVAIVGSRSATPQGVANARAFARDLSAAGITVVSGLAAGIDGAAHEGGLAGPGSTVAVMGTGADRVYPRRHAALAERIAETGLLLTEYPLGTAPVAANFPKRNRIIAGLALGTLVVEAARPSGSLITARLAADMNREVFAIPGSIHAPQARGCHWLIREGAMLVESAADVIDGLQLPSAALWPTAVAENDADASEGDPVLAALGYDPVNLDALLARTGLDAATLQARLLTLELEGRVARLPGGMFQQQRLV